MSSNGEQRRARRVTMAVPARLYFPRSPVPCLLSTINLSTSGAGFIDPEGGALPTEQILLRLSLHTTELECKAVVRWCAVEEDGCGFGVQFVDLGQEESASLATTIYGSSRPAPPPLFDGLD
jgi:hypothetical protein